MICRNFSPFLVTYLLSEPVIVFIPRFYSGIMYPIMLTLPSNPIWSWSLLPRKPETYVCKMQNIVVHISCKKTLSELRKNVTFTLKIKICTKMFWEFYQIFKKTRDIRNFGKNIQTSFWDICIYFQVQGTWSETVNVGICTENWKIVIFAWLRTNKTNKNRTTEFNQKL